MSYLVTYICKYCPVTAGFFQADKEVQSCVFVWVVGGGSFVCLVSVSQHSEVTLSVQ